MKGIILFFTVVFALLGAGVFFYETQVAAPRAGAILKKQLANPEKKAKESSPVAEATPKTASPTIVTALNGQIDLLEAKKDSLRIIDLNSPYETRGVDVKEQEAILKSLDESIKKTIQESIRIDIQKAVASEISRQR